MSYSTPREYESDFGRKNEWMPTPRREEVRWQWGHPQKRKKLLQDFIKDAGAHGIAYMNPKNDVSRCSRVTYKIMFWVCFVMVIGNSFFLVQSLWYSESSFINTMRKDSVSGEELDPEYFPSFPRITICRKPFHQIENNMTELIQYAALASGYPFSPLTPEEVGHLSTINQWHKHPNFTLNHPKAAEFWDHLRSMHERYKDTKKNWKNFDIRRFFRFYAVGCDEVFKSCVIVLFTMECCNIFTPVITNMGVCYTLVSTAPVEEVLDAFPMDFSFSIDLISPPKTDRAVEVGFQIFLTDFWDNDDFDFSRFEGQKVVPGVATTITTHLRKVDRFAQHTAWHGLSTHCPTLPYSKGVDRYTFDTCTSYYINEQLKEHCQCQTLVTSKVVPGKRICDPYDHYMCMIRVGLQSNLSAFEEKCQEPCISYSFPSEAKYMSLETEDISRVEIIYDTKMYSLHQHRAFTLSGFFSQIGGVLGLYLGASIITLVEMLVFALSYGWYSCIPHRTSCS